MDGPLYIPSDVEPVVVLFVDTVRDFGYCTRYLEILKIQINPNLISVNTVISWNLDKCTHKYRVHFSSILYILKLMQQVLHIWMELCVLSVENNG